MKTKPITLNILTLLALAVVLLRGQGAGPLNPPAAPADGVYKTLDQVEPRTPIHNADLPLVISQAGSYYFAENLAFTAASGDAITVTADHTTIDLNGFTLSSSAGVTGRGIRISSDYVTVRNGHITGTSEFNVSGGSVTEVSLGGFANGITAAIPGGTIGKRSAVQNLHVTGCRERGIRLSTGSRFASCTAASNGGVGLFGDTGSIATHCSAVDNATDGISMSAGVITHCVARNNGGVGLKCINGTVTTGNAGFNLGNGIEGGVVAFCTSFSNLGIAIVGGARTGNNPTP